MQRNTVENIIKMINILQSRTLVSGSELAEKLNVSKKTVQKYKDDLEKMHIYIETKRGRYGGYYLDKKILDFNIPISKDEFSALVMAKENLKNDKEFIFIRELNDALEKIEVGLKFNNEEFTDDASPTNNSKPNVNNEFERRKHIDFSDTAIKKKKLKITFISLQSGKTERNIHPYATFMCKGFWYLLAFCELRKEVRSFKISKITEYNVVDESFEIPQDFDLKENIENSIESFNNEERKVILKIDHPMIQFIKERIWAKDQKIKYDDKNKSIIFEATMPISHETVSWILSMGRHVNVLEPEFLKNHVKKELEQMMKNFRKL